MMLRGDGQVVVPIPEGARCTALHQLELITRCICDDNLHPAKECVDMAVGNDHTSTAVAGCMQQLKDLYPSCVKNKDWKVHGCYLWEVHGGFLTASDFNVELIKSVLEIVDDVDRIEPSEEPDREPTNEEVLTDSDLAWSEGSMIVESNAERLQRYQFSGIEEVSDIEYWQCIHHHQLSSDSSDSE